MTDVHNEYFIEKEQLPVEITLDTNEQLPGSIFVQPTWRRPSIEFDAPVLLNLPDAYFPMQLADGTTRLVAKTHVVLIRGPSDDEGMDGEPLGEPATVRVHCSHGVQVRGVLLIARITSNMRVLDFLNHSSEQFIPLRQEGATVLVNRRHIVMVHDESDGTT